MFKTHCPLIIFILGNYDIVLNLDFVDGSARTYTILMRKTICFSLKLFKYGDQLQLIKPLKNEIYLRKKALRLKNPNDDWIKKQQLFEFNFYYRNRYLNVKAKMPLDKRLEIRGVTALRKKCPKQLTTKTFTNYVDHKAFKKQNRERFLERKADANKNRKIERKIRKGQQALRAFKALRRMKTAVPELNNRKTDFGEMTG